MAIPYGRVRFRRQDSSPAASGVTVRGLCKKFGSYQVLDSVDLSAAPGEVVSLIGSSGSGKSTLLRCINFLEVPDQGEIVIGNEPVLMKRRRDGTMRPADRQQIENLRVRVGMVFQNFNLWLHMTVLENIIEAPVHVLKHRYDDAVENAHRLLKKVGLADKADHYPSSLSGGQQQRAAIARTLAMHPRVILLDEPTSALDPELVGEVLGVIACLAEEGNTMILVTHEIHFAREVSHRTMFLHQGMVEEEGLSKDIFANPKSTRLIQFLTRVL